MKLFAYIILAGGLVSQFADARGRSAIVNKPRAAVKTQEVRVLEQVKADIAGIRANGEASSSDINVSSDFIEHAVNIITANAATGTVPSPQVNAVIGVAQNAAQILLEWDGSPKQNALKLQKEVTKRAGTQSLPLSQYNAVVNQAVNAVFKTGRGTSAKVREIEQSCRV